MRVSAAALNKAALYLARALKGQRGLMGGSRELRALGQPIGNTVAIFSDVRGKTQLNRKVIGKARTGVSTRPVIGVVRLNRDRGFSNKRTGQRGRNIHTVEAGRVGKRTGDV